MLVEHECTNEKHISFIQCTYAISLIVDERIKGVLKCAKESSCWCEWLIRERERGVLTYCADWCVCCVMEEEDWSKNIVSVLLLVMSESHAQSPGLCLCRFLHLLFLFSITVETHHIWFWSVFGFLAALLCSACSACVSVPFSAWTDGGGSM